VSIADEPELRDIGAWDAAQPERQDELAALVSRARSDFELVRVHELEQRRVAIFRHRRCGLEFTLIPGGRLAQGLAISDGELLRTIDDHAHGEAPETYLIPSSTPVRDVTVHPFLCARFPVGAEHLEGLVALDVKEPRKTTLVTRRQAAQVASALELDIPSESQWEWACRGATARRTLFWWGNGSPEVRYAELERTHMLDDFRDEAANDRVSNPFGLVSLWWGEICADAWHDDYTGAPASDRPWIDGGEPLGVVRGGGRRFWPWQAGDEWRMVLSAFRMPFASLSDYFREIALRPVARL
jgi:formylglycine-generating enzyme required for sulfatase activity